MKITSSPLARDDIIVVGGPVWAARAAPPVLSALRSLSGDAQAMALFVTCRGGDPRSPPEPALEAMKAAALAPVLAARIFYEAEIAGPESPAVAGFAERVKAGRGRVISLRSAQGK